MKDDYNIERLKRAALVETGLLKQEFDLIVERTRKQEASTFYEGIDLSDFKEDELRDLFEERKDRKYAALTIELYAIAEQMLKAMYEGLFSNTYKKGKDNTKNVIQDLEGLLKKHLNIKKAGSLKRLALVRNYIVHNSFSMKRARKDNGIQGKSKDLYSELHNNVIEYINSISFK